LSSAWRGRPASRVLFRRRILVPAWHAQRTHDEARTDKCLILYERGEPGAIHCSYDGFPYTIPALLDSATTWVSESRRGIRRRRRDYERTPSRMLNDDDAGWIFTRLKPDASKSVRY